MPQFLKNSARGLALLLLAGTLTSLPSCRSHHRDDAAGPQASAAQAGSLAPLVLRADSPDLLLTWLDPQGDFHVVQHPTDVPEAQRDQVRVVVATQEAGTGEQVYVADLRQVRGDGSYVVRTLARQAWDELGAGRRKARLEALAPAAAPPPPGPAPSAAAGSMVAVIYGAKWCKACHETEAYLKGKGVQVLEKDVDQSAAVQAELRAKFARAGMAPTNSIPVTEIGGRLIVGFDPNALQAALDASRGNRAL